MMLDDTIASDLDDFVRRTLSQIVRFLRFDAAILYGYASESNLLWPLARNGDVRDRIPPVVPGSSFISSALAADAPLLANEAAIALSGNLWLREECARTALRMSLRSGTELSGVLVAFSRSAIDVTPEMLRATKIFSMQLTSAIRRTPSLVTSDIQRYHIEAITNIIGTAATERLANQHAMYQTIARHACLLTGAQVVAFAHENRVHAFFESYSLPPTQRSLTMASNLRVRTPGRSHTIVRRTIPLGNLRLGLLWRSRFLPTQSQLRMIDLIAHTLAAVNGFRRRLVIAESERRGQYLTTVGTALSLSLDFSTVLAQTEAFIVPEIADYVAVSHEFSEIELGINPTAPSPRRAQYFLDDVLTKTSTVEAAISSGRSVQMRFDPPAAGDIVEVVIEPMLSDNRALGTISFGRTSTLGHATKEDRVMYENVTARAASALVNAAAFSAEREIANILQAALLSTPLPVDDRIIFDAAYIPAGRKALVGGDWFDVFLLDKNRFAVSMGDVCGHGVRASITMNVARLAFRAAALHGSDPICVLRSGDAMLALENQTQMVTAIYGVIDVTRNIFSYACAGHIPPYRLHDGVIDPLETNGHPLGTGLAISTERSAFEVPFRPGDTLVFYTDGLVEYGRDLIAGERRLRDILLNIPGNAPLETLARDLHAMVFSNADSVQDDDVAILAISMCPVTAEMTPDAFVRTLT